MNNNFDENTMNNIKNMVDSGDINGAISQISPEMIQNFSKMLSQTQNGNSNNNGSSNSNSNDYQNNTSNNFAQSNNNSSSNSSGNGSNFDFSNIDMNAVMKMASNLNLNNSNRNDPRGNLLSALKPYMRDSKKGKMDYYMNLLNMAKMADLFKNNSNNMPNSSQEKH